MEKYLKIKVLETLANPQDVLNRQNYDSEGFFLVKNEAGTPFIVQTFKDSGGLYIGPSVSYRIDTDFPLLSFDNIAKPQTDTLKKELEELKKK